MKCTQDVSCTGSLQSVSSCYYCYNYQSYISNSVQCAAYHYRSVFCSETSLHVVHCAGCLEVASILHCRSRLCKWCTEKIFGVQGSSAVHILSAFYFDAQCKSTWCRWCTEKSVGSSAKSGPIWQAALLAHLKLSSFISTIGIGRAKIIIIISKSKLWDSQDLCSFNCFLKGPPL